MLRYVTINGGFVAFAITLFFLGPLIGYDFYFDWIRFTVCCGIVVVGVFVSFWLADLSLKADEVKQLEENNELSREIRDLLKRMANEV